MRWHKPGVVIALGVALVAYLVVRPMIAAAWPYVHLAEFPALILVLGLVLWGAMRRPRVERPEPAPAWHRHEQIVRALPDPEAERLRMTLASWVANGARPDEAADVVARAVAPDPASRGPLRESLAAEMHDLRSPRRRESFVVDRLTNAKTKPGA